MNELKVFGLLGLLLALSSLPRPAQAQSAPRALGEQDAVARAVAQNPTLHVALLRASQSRLSVTAEQALYTPIFDASAGYTHSRSPSLFGTDAVRIGTSDVVDVGAGITKPFSFGTVVSASLGGQRTLRSSGSDAALLGGGAVGPGYSLVGQLAVSHPLLRGSGNDVGLASLRQARLALGASELAAQQAASPLLAQVVSAYWAPTWPSPRASAARRAPRGKTPAGCCGCISSTRSSWSGSRRPTPAKRSTPC